MKFRIIKKASSDYSFVSDVVALLLLCAPCWPWLYAHAHERKQMKIMLVLAIKANCENDNKRNDTLIIP